jgi:DNA-binding beta-propeller fold protein YncE
MKRKIQVTLFLLLLVSSSSVPAQEPPALSPRTPIALTKVEGRMDHLGVDVKGQRLFATAFDNHTLEVIDLKTGRQVRTISDLDEPQGSFYDAANNRLYVANGGDGTVLARWPVSCTTNFPMALDEAHHRLFVGCRIPARLAVFDTETGKIVASPTIVEHTDDLFFDASKGRIYILGEGFIEAWQQKDPDHYDRIARYPTPADGRTGLFVPELALLFETIPHHGSQGAEILVYETR